jgi:AcrR family transcriptional regulator
MEVIATRDSLLDAAESLFSEHGIQAASLRAITQQANANLAAVHYHFGSKEGLVKAVFARRLRPLHEERLRLLAECDLAGADAVEQVLHAFLAPLFRLIREAPEGTRGFARLMGRAFSEPNDEVRAIVVEEFTETVERFTAALSRLLPHLPRPELQWRFHFVAGSMAHTVSCGYLLERNSGGSCRVSDTDEALRHLVTFLAAGLRAPATSIAE